MAELLDVCNVPKPAHEVIEALITFDGRQPIGVGLGSLDFFARHVFDFVRSAPSVLATRTPTPECGVLLYLDGLGRLHIVEVAADLPSYADGAANLVGHLGLAAQALQALRERTARSWEREAALRRRIDATLAALGPAAVDDVVAAVDDAVRHVESVCIYIDDQLFSLMEHSKTLLRPGLLAGLGNATSSWSPAERLAVAAFYALWVSGRSIRFEEFSGGWLTAEALFAKLHHLAASYVDEGQPRPTPDADLFALAEFVGEAGRGSVGKPWLRYRWISGWTFLKTERQASAADRAEVPDALSSRLAAFVAEATGSVPRPGATCADTMEHLAGIVVERTRAGDHRLACGPATTAVERFIQEVVTAAVEESGADYGMSSSLRDLSVLCGDDRLARTLVLRPVDFFTCVVSRAGLRAHLGDGLVTDVYAAVQRRMQFNRWHFIAGNFPEASVPSTRHYYYPPLTPDLAEWSDVHHGGHQRAGVRYSIRAPGPDMGDPPLAIGGHPFRGFYDVRVVRMEGLPFTLRELLIVRNHTTWLGALWRAMAAAPLTIEGFALKQGFEPETNRQRRAKATVRTVPQLVDQSLVSTDEVATLAAVAERYSLAITPEMVALMDDSPGGEAVRAQFVPTAAEATTTAEERADPIGDEPFTPVKGVTHRYRDRVLLKPVHVCPVYCRFCFRREKVGPGSDVLTEAELDTAFDYIRSRPEIWEVIFTGGDPLIVAPRRLGALLARLVAIPHVKVIRFHTRIPVVDPSRVNADLVAALKCGKPVYIVLHTNHAHEMSADARRACARLVDAGIPMLSQSVLLRGVNDTAPALEALFRTLVENRIKPYYLHQGDLASGTSHFRTSIPEGQALMRQLRGDLSGVCQPTYVLDIPGGKGKVPIGPGYLGGDGPVYRVTDPNGAVHTYPPTTSLPDGGV